MAAIAATVDEGHTQIEPAAWTVTRHRARLVFDVQPARLTGRWGWHCFTCHRSSAGIPTPAEAAQSAHDHADNYLVNLP